MGQIVRAIDGMAEACRALDFPVVSGNVSLYNETNGAAIPPTPTVGGVGLIDDYARRADFAFDEGGDTPVAGGREPRRTRVRASICANASGREDGAPPPVDLAAERRNGDFVRALIRAGKVSAVHDLSDGGLDCRGGRDGPGLGRRRRTSTPPAPPTPMPSCSARTRPAT